MANVLRIGVSIGERMVKLDTDHGGIRLEEWAPVLDKLLLGVTHNISNRVATLAGVSDILSSDSTVPPILRALADEVPRLEESIRLLRLLAAPDDERDEALEATRVVDDAVSLARLHPACHGVVFAVRDRTQVPPVIARPTGLTHELVIALASSAAECHASVARDADVAAQAGQSDPSDTHAGLSVPVVFTSDGCDLVITVGSCEVRARLLSAGRV